MPTKTLTVEVENEGIDLEEMVEKHDITVTVAPDVLPVKATVGPLLAVDDD